jgi:hypothetical protein
MLSLIAGFSELLTRNLGQNGRIIDWLLERDQPWVRYNTLVGLLSVPNDSVEARDALADMMSTPPASKILETLDQDGGFTDKATARRWGELAVRGGYVPKYRGSAWKLLFLAQINADRENEKVKALGGHTLANAYDTDHETFNIHLDAGGRSDYALIPCFMGNMVWALTRLGFGDRHEVRSTFDWLVKYQRFDDGGWSPSTIFPYKGSRERCWGRHTCYWGVTSLLRAMTVVPHGFWTSEAEEAKKKAIDFALAHRLIWSSHDPAKPIATKNTRPQRLTAPLSYYHDAIEITTTMLSLGVRGEAIDDVIKFVISKRNEKGRWFLENSPGSLDSSWGAKEHENKWITFRALRMLKLTGRLELD